MTGIVSRGGEQPMIVFNRFSQKRCHTETDPIADIDRIGHYDPVKSYLRLQKFVDWDLAKTGIIRLGSASLLIA